MESIQISMLKENRRIVAFDTLRYIWHYAFYSDIAIYIYIEMAQHW